MIAAARIAAPRIAKTAIVYPNVQLGAGSVVEDYCVIGAPLRDGSEPKTIILENAHIRSFTVIYAGNTIGKNFQTGNKANIRENNIIGDNVSIGTMSVIEHQIKIEDNVRIHTQVFIPEFSVLKKGCWIGPHVVLTNAKFPNRPETKNQLMGVVVESGAVIGANSTVSPGINVGAKSIIGCGATVTKDVKQETIVVGNPARVK